MDRIKKILRYVLIILVFPLVIVFITYKFFFKVKNITIISSKDIKIDNMPKVDDKLLQTAIDKGKDILNKMENE